MGHGVGGGLGCLQTLRGLGWGTQRFYVTSIFLKRHLGTWVLTEIMLTQVESTQEHLAVVVYWSESAWFCSSA